MPDFGFPAQYRQANMRSLISQMRDQSDDARFESVTERYRDVTGELDGRVNELMQIEKSLNDLRGYNEAIALSEGRARIMQEVLVNVRSTVQDLTDTADVLRTNGTDLDLSNLSVQAESQLGSIVTQLNTSIGGRGLFTGDEANTPALASQDVLATNSIGFLTGAATGQQAYDALEAEFMNAGGLFDTTFYLGGTGNAPRTEVGPGEVIDYTVKADEDPLRRMLLNVTVMAAAFDLSNGIPDDQRQTLLDLTTINLRNTVPEMLSVESRLGSAEARIATMKARNTASEASLTLSFNDLAAADPYDSAVKLTQLEAQLEVAFATTARLANLSLANFR